MRESPGVAADHLRPHLASNATIARPVVRNTGDLRPHPALVDLGFTDFTEELNEAALLKNEVLPDAILVTSDGIILAGLGRWRLAWLQNTPQVQCIEYAINDTESLQFILRVHNTHRGWNSFVRVRLALTLEPYFQGRALENMRAGGRYKGSANLPEASRIDVRQEIAATAGVGARNVSNVKAILNSAIPRLIEAVQNDALSINAAVHLSGLPKREQAEQLVRHIEDREISRVIDRSVSRRQEVKTTAEVITLLDKLSRRESRHPGSVAVQIDRRRHAVIVVAEEVLKELCSQREPELLTYEAS